MKNNKQSKRMSSWRSYAILFVCLLVFVFPKAKFVFSDDTATDGLNISEEEQKKIEKKQKEIKKLEEKAATYEKILQLKQKQKTLLGSQINNLNAEINDVKRDIKETKEQMEELDRKIEEMKNRIDQKEKMIKLHRKLLAKVLRAYYEKGSSINTDVLLGINSFAELVSSGDRFSQLGKKITDITSDLKTMQENLKKEQDELKKAKNDIVEARIRLEEENSKLTAVKMQKNSLLIQTQGDEAKYKRRLAKIEKQKKEILGDIDELFNANYAELEAMATKAPSKYWASMRWYYSQKDSRWGNKNIGNSKSKMKDYGCAVTAVSMVFTYHGERISPGTLRRKSIFSWDLINWPRNSGVVGLGSSVQLSSGIGHGNINWSTVDKNIKNGNPVIVFISAKRGAGHYVVIHHKAKNGKYVVHDPYFGANIYLDTTFKLLSKIYKTSVSKKSVDQMIIYK